MKKKIQDLLRQLEKTSKKFWNIPPETGFFLNQLIKTQNYKKVLEIGTSNGYSGIWIAEALSQNNGHLYTIESHKKERFGLAKENFKKADLTAYITQILGHAPEALPKTPKKFDLIFLDATKYEHLDYFKAIKNRLNKHGLIISDNINSHKKDLNSFIKEIEKNPDFQSIILNIGTGLLICTHAPSSSLFLYG